MKINLICQDPSFQVDEQFESHIHETLSEQILHRVGRFEDQISHIDVRIADENAVKGGIDKVCKIDLFVHHREPIHVQAKEATVPSAVSRAIHKAAHALEKVAGRRRKRKGAAGHESTFVPPSE